MENEDWLRRLVIPCCRLHKLVYLVSDPRGEIWLRN